ncbi:hypothetical protein HDU76_013138 [Blyttiomyces sp. JEL0837]|nr:hypothetical protein HDU76_013138 [Blyttiomyces sp. JEL0837]
MEKYSRWRDPGTGIPPFLPPKRLRTNESVFHTVLSTVKTTVIGPVFSALKLVVILAVALVGALLDFAGVILVVPFLKRFWTRLIAFLFGRLTLLLLGFWWIKSSYVNLKKGLREKQELKRISANKTIQHGDIIVANHSSYVEVMYLYTMYAPTFIHLSRTGKLRPIDFAKALFSVGDYPTLEDPEDTLTIQELSDKARKEQTGPIVVFPEATTSNGRGLLQFTPVFDIKGVDIEKMIPRIHLFGFRFDFEDYAPTYTIGGKLSHVIGLGAQFANYFEVKILAPEEVKLIDPQAGPLGKQLAALIGQMLRLRMTSLSVTDKKEFFDYYMERESKKSK